MKTRAFVAIASLIPLLWLTACEGEIGDASNDDDDGGSSVSGTGGNTSTSGVGGSSSGNGGGSTTSSGMGGASSPSSSGSGASTSSSGSSASSSSGGPACGGSGPGTTPLDSEEQAFLGIINNYRQQNNLGTLTACVSMNRAAQGHSEDMRDNNYFSHTGLNNSTPWDRTCDACFDLGCGPQTAMAENIAAGNSDAQATFTQWMNSPGHDANMRNGSFNYIGIGRATGGGQYGVYWTNVFAGDDEPSCY